MIWDGSAFKGAKIALICGEKLVTYLRDDKQAIPFPDRWDLPGGGREGDESPVDCVLRETQEEFGLKLPASRMKSATFWKPSPPYTIAGWFFVMHITEQEVDSIRFGEEGQFWQMMPIAEFLKHERGIPQQQAQLQLALTLPADDVTHFRFYGEA